MVSELWLCSVILKRSSLILKNEWQYSAKLCTALSSREGKLAHHRGWVVSVPKGSSLKQVAEFYTVLHYLSNTVDLLSCFCGIFLKFVSYFSKQLDCWGILVAQMCDGQPIVVILWVLLDVWPTIIFPACLVRSSWKHWLQMCMLLTSL